MLLACKVLRVPRARVSIARFPHYHIPSPVSTVNTLDKELPWRLSSNEEYPNTTYWSLEVLYCFKISLYSVRVIELGALHSSPYFPICLWDVCLPSLHSHSFNRIWLLHIWKHLFIAFCLFFLDFKGLTVSSLPPWVLPGRGKHSRIQKRIEFEASCSSKEYGVSSQSNQAFFLRWLRTL